MEVLEGGRRTDAITGEIQPWYTHAALDEIQQWDLDGKVVLEWGGGYSSLWWAKRCRQVFTVEDKADWCEWMSAQASTTGIVNLSILHRSSNLPADEFTRIPDGCAPDIIVIDGARRFECLAKALTLPRPLIVIFDNWRKGEPSRWEGVEKLMGPYLGVSYAQHDAYVGHQPWQTAIWRLAANAPSPGIDFGRAPLGRPALSAGWNGTDVERRFADNAPGLAVIDGVLTDEALEELHRFCLDSTIWSSGGHRLRASFEGEAWHPTLVQVAEQLQRRLPRVIGERNPLRAILGYKLGPNQSAESGMRRDFAAVSVTLWVTLPPKRDTSNGLVFYDVRTSKDVPGDALESRKADVERLPNGLRRTNAVTVPYRRNRAVIFNADLLREGPTQSFPWDEGPMSLTLLFGRRRPAALSRHQQSAAAPVGAIVPAVGPFRAWRSAAFGKVRRA
jgi:hypothetical protein